METFPAATTAAGGGGVSVHVEATEAEKPAGRTTHMQIKSPLIFGCILLRAGKAGFAAFADTSPVRTGGRILLICGQIGIFLLASTESISLSGRAELLSLPSRRETARVSVAEARLEVGHYRHGAGDFSQNYKQNSGRCVFGTNGAESSANNPLNPPKSLHI